MTATAEPPPRVGKARVRKEDARLITGRTRWTDNIALPGMLHIAIVRSPSRTRTITEHRRQPRPRQMPGVVAVYTGADLAAEQGGLPCAWPITADMKSPQRPLARRRHGQLRRRGRRRRRGPQRRRGRRTPPRRSRSTTTSSTRCSTWRPRSPTAPTSCTRTSAPTRAPPGCSTPARPAPAADVDEAIAAAEADPTGRGQAPVPPAAADPGVHGAALRASSTRPASSSPCGRPPRSRTSCARCSR